MTLIPFSIFSDSDRKFEPSVAMPEVWELPARSSDVTPRSWWASSRVGVKTITPVPLRGLNRLDSRREIEDIRAARDFPLPGLDIAITYKVDRLGLMTIEMSDDQ